MFCDELADGTLRKRIVVDVDGKPQRDAKLIELGGGTTEIQELTAGRWLVESYEI